MINIFSMACLRSSGVILNIFYKSIFGEDNERKKATLCHSIVGPIETRNLSLNSRLAYVW